MDSMIESTFTRSFQARLYACIDEWQAPLRPSKYVPLGTSDAHLQLLNNGWLQVGGAEDASPLDFTFIDKTPDRLHYHIYLPAAGGPVKLGVSRNGYLGFYKVAEVTDYWKIEPLKLTDQGLLCNLRDQSGQRVAVYSDVPRDSSHPKAYMNVQEGKVFTFLLKPVG
jgi:hypothetical protein